MTQHPTEPGLDAQGGSEAAGTDILGRAHALRGANWFLPGGEINLPAVLEASNVLGELAAEVEPTTPEPLSAHQRALLRWFPHLPDNGTGDWRELAACSSVDPDFGASGGG